MAAELQARDGYAGFLGGYRLAADHCRSAGRAGRSWLLAGLVLGSVVPFTLIVMWPTNKQPEDPGLETTNERARSLLVRWGRLHGIRSALSLLALILMMFAAS